MRPRVTVANGLSPLARGTLLAHHWPQVKNRFIPAGAGNTRMNGRACGPNSVYPRWRGEHAGGFNLANIDDGLSPLARGTPPARDIKIVIARFIPAGAGNTGKGIVLALNPPVYPRWRGEHTKHT
ncbi:Domain of uncharacterised function (DUF2825) [Escherichia coli]|nr:Domain of uncharacterised function (DUF2825) [Escherichia coli]